MFSLNTENQIFYIAVESRQRQDRKSQNRQQDKSMKSYNFHHHVYTLS